MTDTVTPDTETVQEPPSGPHEAAAAALRADAAQLRADVAEDRESAAQRLSAAQQEAARIVRDAQNAVNEAATAALRAEREAADLEDTANFHAAAASLTTQIADTEAQLAALDDEHANLTAQAAGIETRITELALTRQATQSNIEQAIDDGDAAHLAKLRGEAAGLEEISRNLTAKLAPIRARIAAIGTRADGDEARTEIPAAVRRLAWLRGELERHLDHLDPSRPGASQRAFVRKISDLQAYAAANPPAPTKQHSTVTRRPDGTYRADITRH